MRSIRRMGPFIVLLGTLSAGVLAPVALGSQKPVASSHKLRLVGEIDTLSSTGQIARPGTRDTDSGILNGTVSGAPRWNGALTQVVTWGPALAISSKGTAFDLRGTLRFTLTGKFTPRAKGLLALSGELAVTGGTGSYNHARGMLQVTGVAPFASDPDAASFNVTGSLRY